MAGGDFLPLAQNAFARWKIIIPDFVWLCHLRISKAQNVGRELVAAVHAECIGLLGECDNVFLAARKVLNHDTGQTILALEPYEPVLEDYERKDINSWPVRNEIAPVSPAGGGERRPSYLEILCAISIGSDDQRRRAFEYGMVFHFVLDAGLACGNESGQICSVGRRKIAKKIA